MTASVNHWVKLWLLVIVRVSFGHPQQTPPPTPRKGAQVHVPRATQISGFSSTQSNFEHDLALTFQPTLLPTADAACSFVSSAFSSCNSETPGFYTMDPYQQAQCLCFGSNGFNPTLFVDPADSCALFVSTEAPSIYSQIPIFSNLDHLCGNSTVTSSGTTITGATQSSPGAGATQTSSPSGNAIDNFTPGEIAGISVGCGLAALLAGFGIFVGCRRKREQEGETVEEVDGSFPSPKEKRSSVKEKAPSVSEISRGQSVEIHDPHYVLPARVII